MDRRNFLKQVAVFSSGILLAEPVFRITPDLLAAEAVAPILSIGTGKNYTSLVSSVLQPLGGMAAFVKPGDHVVIKPNIGWDRRPEQAANTHPEIVRAVVELAIMAGAKTVQVFDRTCNEERRCYVNSGIKPALDAMDSRKVQCNYIDERKFIPVTIEKGKSINKWSFYKDALQADCYINIPVAKHHGLARLTLGMKNTMGVIGGNRGKIHGNMGQNLADLNTVIRANLTIIDATRILLRNGPQGGSLKDVKVLDTVLASPDPVAADAYATTLFGLKPDEIDSTRAAAEMGLGEMDLNKMDIRTV
ncbi:MAG: DUF362 domain-containing protein [Proteobacteria bacterium]|nr:DUF362 domain-containing protein [Pseudomonadota bacterium]MBU1138540.1 DUF362 domain-containing protein [Pseudomonadota bacterium]MBU1234158.1 DUF362 domain-containing protein [Pseudomonadota bacterium]MBU1419323.1 DUF362 domain-containing protein [Pseudomonadota bacterium]MBU1455154.1 DUF362 domain-containing protein [Pseudomonadota bacterium]